MDGNWYLDLASGNWTLTVPPASTLVSVLNWAQRYSGITNVELLAQEPTGIGLSVTVLGFTDDALTLRTTGAGAIQPVRVTFANSQQEVIRLAFVAPMVLAPVTLAEAKAFLRVQTTDEDLLITSLVRAARQAIEDYTFAVCRERAETLLFDGFGKRLVIEAAPLVAVTSVTYLDTEGDLQTLAPADYRVTELHGVPVIVPAPGAHWPATLNGAPDAVRVAVMAGWPDNAAVDETVRHAALLLVSNAYDDRSGPMVMSDAVKQLLGRYRLRVAL
jgi:uncharacterized phiE125 gp8 family phage protein